MNVLLFPVSFSGAMAGGLGLAGGLANILTGAGNIPGLMNSVFIDTQSNLVDITLTRNLVEHNIPGREGGILQDMGSKSPVLHIAGKWIYENKPKADLLSILSLIPLFSSLISWNWARIQVMYYIFRSRIPVLVACDFAIGFYMIEKMTFKMAGGNPNVYDYDIILKELTSSVNFMAGIGLGVGIQAFGLGEFGR